MVKVSEECLDSLGFAYIKNYSETAAEFEIAKPVNFRILIEPNSFPEIDRLLFRSVTSPKGVTIDVRVKEANYSGEHERGVQTFFRALIEALPQKPWVGIDGIMLHREESKWNNLLRSSRF